MRNNCSKESCMFFWASCLTIPCCFGCVLVCHHMRRITKMKIALSSILRNVNSTAANYSFTFVQPVPLDIATWYIRIDLV